MTTTPAAPRSDLAEAGRMLLRTVLPAGVLLGLALTVYGVTGHDLTIVLQDRFPEDSEYSGLFTILFSSALMVCAGITLGSILLARARTGGADASPALTAGAAVAVLAVFIGFDDVMMVHDAMLTGAGIPESVGLAAYGVVGVVLVAWAYRPMRAERLGITFLVPLALLGASLGGDVVESFLEDGAPALATAVGHGEDVVKFLAYAALCHLCVLLAGRVTARALDAAPAPSVAAPPVTASGRHALPTPRGIAVIPSRPRPAPAPDDEVAALTAPIPRVGHRDVRPTAGS